MCQEVVFLDGLIFTVFCSKGHVVDESCYRLGNDVLDKCCYCGSKVFSFVKEWERDRSCVSSVPLSFDCFRYDGGFLRVPVYDVSCLNTWLQR